MKKTAILVLALVVTTACTTVTEPPTKSAVQTVYNGFAAGDIALATSTMSPDIIWMEAEGNPYSDLNPYEGPEAIVNGLFVRLATEWESFTATPEEYFADGDRVVVLGQYTAMHRATGKAINVPFVHAYTVRDGVITAFQQHTDTRILANAMMGYEDVNAVLEERTDIILSAVRTGDTSEVLKLFTEDAIYSPDGKTLLTTGEDLAGYWEAVVDSPAVNGVLEVVDIEWLAPEAFVELQRYEVFDAQGESLFGGYASLLWRKVDGVWLIARDVSN